MNTIKMKATPMPSIEEFKFKPEDVDKLYIGKPNLCMCGCSGKYYIPGETKAGDTKIFKAISFFETAEEIEHIDKKIFTRALETISYTLYFKKALK